MQIGQQLFKQDPTLATSHHLKPTITWAKREGGPTEPKYGFGLSL